MNDDNSRWGVYTPPPEDYETFDAREAEQGRRGWLFLAAGAVVLILFSVVVYNTFQLGVRDRNASPVIAADTEPYRITPDDPGGYETPNQDLSAYDLVESAAPESVPPSAEEPAVSPPALPALQVEQADADTLDEPPAGAATDESPPAQEPAQEPVPAPRPALREQAPASVPPAAAQGDFIVQIGAYRSVEDAEAGWMAFVSRYPEFANNRTPDIQRADLGDRGVFHRLRIAAFETREDAVRYCSMLDARGQACLVARR